jgi:ATP-dependent DNA helicase RecG
MPSNESDLIRLVNDLVGLPTELEWVEFKSNYQSPEKIGEYVSALSNSACLHQQNDAYLLFGVDNLTHDIVGTTFDYRSSKGKGAEPLITWLNRQLKPTVNFEFKEITHPSGRLVMLFIPPAGSGPIKFKGRAWVRIGSNNKPLDDFPEKEAIIWERRTPFEERVAREQVSESTILDLLDYDQYFRLVAESPRPRSEDAIIEKLLQEDFLNKKKGRLNITNLGAILLAHDLRKFSKLKGKAVRIITYQESNRLVATKDVTITQGYAVGFSGIISYIQSQIPEPETIDSALRSVSGKYPKKSLRELVANALVHQDFSITGASPMIEIFDNRIEISNPGKPLIEPERFIDHPPLSRNEKLTDRLRRMRICEKRGSGVDRAFLEIELAQLPPPKIEKRDDGVKVTIYGYKNLAQLTKDEQCRACYYHSCIKYVIDQEALTNDSLSKRLGIKRQNKAIASRIIRSTLSRKWIKPFDPENISNRYAKYLPFWA